MYNKLKSYLDTNSVELVAVSKTKPISAIQELYDQGQRVFGENRVQELVEKHEQLEKDIAWHMIGNLQKNKVKYIAPFIDLIHSVDSLALAKMIDKEAAKNGRVIAVLLQMKVAKEESKSGFSKADLYSELENIISLPNLYLRGMMGMGTFTSDDDITRSEFSELKVVFDDIQTKYATRLPHFRQLSMGMSGDYELAVEQGTTMVRIGSLLFGSRS